jgi:hypothetical protein
VSTSSAAKGHKGGLAVASGELWQIQRLRRETRAAVATRRYRDAEPGVAELVRRVSTPRDRSRPGAADRSFSWPMLSTRRQAMLGAMTIITSTSHTRIAGTTATMAKQEAALHQLRSQIGWPGVFAARAEQ